MKNVNHTGIIIRSLRDTLTTFSQQIGLKADRRIGLRLIQPASSKSDAECFPKEKGGGFSTSIARIEVEGIKEGNRGVKE